MTRTKTKARAKQQVRIIAGDWRGRKLPVLDVEGLRPTTDRVRETLFNWLMHDVRGATCLDLFAGSGALGFECLSRGAEFVQFVEKDKKAASLLQENLFRLMGASTETKVSTAEKGQVDKNTAVYTGAAAQFLQQRPTTQYDLVFLDPPFASDLLAQSILTLESQEWLRCNALIYIEHAAKGEAPTTPDTWLAIKRGSVGQSNFSLWQRSAC